MGLFDFDEAYTQYDFKVKYGTDYKELKTEVFYQKLLLEFDDKLALCLQQIKEKAQSNQDQAIEVYRDQAIQLKTAVEDAMQAAREGSTMLSLQIARENIEVLARTLELFDDILEKSTPNEREAHHKQLLLLMKQLESNALLNKVNTAIPIINETACFMPSLRLRAQRGRKQSSVLKSHWIATPLASLGFAKTAGVGALILNDMGYISGFLAVAVFVGACVLAIPTGGISLIFLAFSVQFGAMSHSSWGARSEELIGEKTIDLFQAVKKKFVSGDEDPESGKDTNASKL